MNDVRRVIYGTIVLFLGVLVAWLSIIYISSCGFTLTCGQAAPKVDRTPIPTLIPVYHAEPQMHENAMTEFNSCQVSAANLIGAWVTAGSPETEVFAFSDVNGDPCEGTYASDIQPLFVENNLWYEGAIGCVSCHNAELAERSGGLDLTTHDAVLLGSRRVAGSSSAGTDILGGGEWGEASTLYTVLVMQGFVPEGHSADNPAVELILYAGQAAEATPTPTP